MTLEIKNTVRHYVQFQIKLKKRNIEAIQTTQRETYKAEFAHDLGKNRKGVDE